MLNLPLWGTTELGYFLIRCDRNSASLRCYVINVTEKTLLESMLVGRMNWHFSYAGSCIVGK
jgi:hypothetical protein